MSFLWFSTHWVGYVCITYSSYLQHRTKKRKNEQKRQKKKSKQKETRNKDRLVKKAPLEVRHTKGGSLKSASGFSTSAQNVNDRHRVSSHHTDNMQNASFHTKRQKINKHFAVTGTMIRWRGGGGRCPSGDSQMTVITGIRVAATNAGQREIDWRKQQQ